MAKVIAGMYEVQQKIGAGGGGVVYLGQHLRLKKKVVLKADKRKLSVGEEKLRREVDMLKSLSQTYIPQVYDFVEDDGIVFTVMDYIDGISLDRLIAQKKYPPQREVLRWACQLLEALEYLHSRPPHGILHGDIKPANIMLRTDGNICLIDYNIALALGEDGAVSVGYSRGYASPEHYGSTNLGLEGPMSDSIRNEKVDSSGIEGLLDSVSNNSGASVSKGNSSEIQIRTGQPTQSQRKEIQLDVRSDVYSLGATLYHLLAKRKPAANAKDVKPLGKKQCSMAVADIINKSMNPDPKKRYQSAAEMLQAIRSIRRHDSRMVWHRRRIAAAALFTTVFLAAGAGLVFAGQRQIRQSETAKVLAAEAQKMLGQGDVDGALQKSLQAVERKSKFDAPVIPQAQKALTDSLGVYDVSDGWKDKGTITLSEKPVKMEISPNGRYLAAVCNFQLEVYDMETQQKLISLPMEQSALAEVVFLDDDHVLYAGEGGIALYDFSRGATAWTGEVCTAIAVSGDGTKAAAVNRDEPKVRIYNVSDGSVVCERDFGDRHLKVPTNDQYEDPENNLLALNYTGSWLAASDSYGGLNFYDLIQESPKDLQLYDTSDYTKFQGGFDSQFFGYAGNYDSGSEYGIVDIDNVKYLSGAKSDAELRIKTNVNGIYIAEKNKLSKMSPAGEGNMVIASLDEMDIADYAVGQDGCVVIGEDGSIHMFDTAAAETAVFTDENIANIVRYAGNYIATADVNANVIRIFEKKVHEEAAFFRYDPTYAHVEARVDAEDQTIMLFSARGFQIYSMDGQLIQNIELPDSTNIYDQQFRRNGEEVHLEVTWYDGNVRTYSAKDGRQLEEYNIDQPSKNLDETFETEKYVFESSMHGATKVYTKEKHELVKALEDNAFVTYVTEMPDGYIVEYIDNSSARYGIYMDKNLEEIARLDGLCDITGDSFIYDFYKGELRKTKIYSLEELISLAGQKLEED